MNSRKINSIAFYDVNLLNHKNYIGDIICEFVSNGYSVTLFYDEFSQEGFDFFKCLDVKIIRNGLVSKRTIEKKLLESRASTLIVNAQRLGDTAFVTVAKEMGIKTGMIQHGMYVPFMKRERFFLVKKAIKTLRYFIYSFIISKALDRKFNEVLKCFLNTFVKGGIYKDSIPFHEEVNTDYVLVYGPYWKDYHRDIFGYRSAQMFDLGYHELSKIDETKNKKMEPMTVCYIAQTLVEDGRLARQLQESFLDALEKLKGVKVVIKLHPRSNRAMYEGRGFRLEEKRGVPHCPLYIGHYSSLLALAGSVSTMVLFEFPGHEIPEYFSRNAAVVNAVEQLSPTIEEILEKGMPSAGGSFDDIFSLGYSPERAFSIIQKFQSET
ncbi:hypothetical protein [Gallaecimonas pentaromativorans]|uniref:hypothetical protein n=2 Tax=Gammaproteobacteria TaxID=1236 RepID=UPI003A8D2528